ncbi:MAG TPA: hypothetical protein VKE40_26545, partial [Gemmataceae bacterium]|nr:hypothetical protein [Gemmataceae bacterium]
MFTFKTEETVAKGARHRMPLKLLFAGILVACAAGGFRLGLVWATPSQGFTSTSLVGPVTLDEFDTMAEADDWK